MQSMFHGSSYKIGDVLRRRKGLFVVLAACSLMLIYGQRVVAEFLPAFHERATQISNGEQTDESVSATVEVSASSETEQDNVIQTQSNGSTAEAEQQVDENAGQKLNVSIKQNSSVEGTSTEVVVNGEEVEVPDSGNTTQRFETEDGTDVRVRVRSDTDENSSSSLHMSINGETIKEGGE